MPTHFGDARDWFFQQRFGLFVHWGLYAIHAWHEQEQWRRGVPRAEYEPLIHQFNPTKCDPNAWLDVLQDAGMEYICLTTKHHDGFCLWDTQQTDFNVMHSPYKRDIVAMLADACHARSVPLCLYYSIADWHHPNYPNQGRHHELAAPEPGDNPDWDAYVQFLKEQIRELCTSYGTIHGIWWDMNVPKHRDPSVNAMIRQLQPNAVVNNRGFDDGDFSTPERHVPEGRRFDRPTEACQSLGRESWGYRADEDYYSAKHLMQSIDKIMAMGGNYLLNVGPKADGTIPDEQVALLRTIGTWFQSIRESFYGAEPASDLTENQDVLLTRTRSTTGSGDILYVHYFKDPESTGLSLHPIAATPTSATLLNRNAPTTAKVELTPRRWQEQWNAGRRGAEIVPSLHLQNLPADDLTATVPVLKLDFPASRL